MTNLPFFCLSLTASFLNFAQGARLPNECTTTYYSMESPWRLLVSPQRPDGAGISICKLFKGEDVQWERAFPITPHAVLLGNDGTIWTYHFEKPESAGGRVFIGSVKSEGQLLIFDTLSLTASPGPDINQSITVLDMQLINKGEDLEIVTTRCEGFASSVRHRYSTQSLKLLARKQTAIESPARPWLPNIERKNHSSIAVESGPELKFQEIASFPTSQNSLDGNSQNSLVRDVDVDGDGNIYILRNGGHEVEVYSHTRASQRAISLTGLQDNERFARVQITNAGTLRLAQAPRAISVKALKQVQFLREYSLSGEQISEIVLGLISRVSQENVEWHWSEDLSVRWGVDRDSVYLCGDKNILAKTVVRGSNGRWLSPITQSICSKAGDLLILSGAEENSPGFQATLISRTGDILGQILIDREPNQIIRLFIEKHRALITFPSSILTIEFDTNTVCEKSCKLANNIISIASVGPNKSLVVTRSGQLYEWNEIYQK